MEATPDQSHFFFTRVKILEHIIQRTTTTPIKPQKNLFLLFQPPSNKNKTQEIF